MTNMGLVNWVFGKKPKASEQAPSTKTLGGTPDGKVKACSQDVSPQANTLSHDEDFTIEELGSAERTLNAETESGDEPDLEARSSNKAQVKRSPSKKSAASSRSSSTVKLFGGDDTDFLDDFVGKAPVPLVFQRPKEALPEDKKEAVTPGISKTGSEDGDCDGDASEEDKEPDGDIASPHSSDSGAQDATEQSALPKSTTSGEDYQTDSPTEDDQHEDEQDTQQGLIDEQETLTEEPVSIIKVPSTDNDPERSRMPIFTSNWGDSDDEGDWPLYIKEQTALIQEPSTDIVTVPLPKPVVGTSWADMDDDDDEWEADQYVIHTTDGLIHNKLHRAEGGSEAETFTLRFPSSNSRTFGEYPSLQNGGDLAESTLNARGSAVGTVTSNYPLSVSDYGAGYDGPSRSLAFHQNANVEQAYRYEEIRRDAVEAYQVQMQKLWECYAADIESLEQPSTIAPDEEDLHDEEMRKIFCDVYPALPSQEPHGKMHILDWKTLTGPHQTGPDPDEEEKFLLHFIKPRLCDAVATLLFESDPSALDAWLDPSKKIVEWWHIPHYLHRGVVRTVVRRDGSDVIVGTFTDLGFHVCWSQYIKAEIDNDGKWSETFAFQGGQFKKQPGEKEPGASSRKVHGEIDWESFEIGEHKYYDVDELCDPVEALWHGRVLAHAMLRTILNNYSQYRSGNTVELVVDGELTSIEQRGVRHVPRINGIENDRIEEVVSSSGMFAPLEEEVPSSQVSSEELNEVELEPMAH